MHADGEADSPTNFHSPERHLHNAANDRGTRLVKPAVDALLLQTDFADPVGADPVCGLLVKHSPIVRYLLPVTRALPVTGPPSRYSPANARLANVYLVMPRLMYGSP